MPDYGLFLISFALGGFTHWVWSLKTIGDLKRINERLNDEVTTLTSRDEDGRFNGGRRR
jgi:hypothetical protein